MYSFQGTAKPGPKDAGCWVLIKISRSPWENDSPSNARQCRHKNRKGKLTCQYHDEVEWLAQERKSRMEAKESP